MRPADPTAIEREHEARHRAEIAALVSRLVPRPRPATDLLISLALPSPSEPWKLIKVGHSERNIDFWDERALAEAYKKVEQPEKLELSRRQVDQVKAIRKALLTACKDVEAELHKPELDEPWLLPRPYSEDVVLARSSAEKEGDRGNLIDHVALQTVLRGASFAESALVSPGDETTSDSLGQLLDLAFAAPATAIETLKRKRQTLRMFRKKSVLESLLDESNAPEEATASISASFSRAQSASPPLFARERTFSRDSEAGARGVDALHLSPCSVKDASSPEFRLDQEWSREAGRLSSPTTSTAPLVHKGRLVESSSPILPDTLPTLTDADFPLFSRESETAAFAHEPHPKTILLVGLEELAEQNDGAVGAAEAPPDGACDKLESLERYAAVMPLAEDAKMDRAHLPFPLNLKVPVELPSKGGNHDKRLPRFADFARTAPLPFSFGSLPGLRSLTIDLTWRTWEVPNATESSAVLSENLGDAEPGVPHCASQPCGPVSPLATFSSFELVSEPETAVYARCEPHEDSQPSQVGVNRFPILDPFLRQDDCLQADDGEISSPAFLSDASNPTSDSGSFPSAPALPATSSASATTNSSAPQQAASSARYLAASSVAIHSSFSDLSAIERIEDRQSGIPEAAPPAARRMDVFLSLRGKATIELQDLHGRYKDQLPAARIDAPSARPGRSPAARPCSPFPAIPAFDDRLLRLSTSQPLASCLNKTVKVVAFDDFTQMRTHLRHLSQRGVHIVHRSNKASTDSEPDLILDPTTCVVLCRVADLLKSNTSDKAGGASLLYRLEELSGRFDTVFLLLEEQDFYVGDKRVSSYNPPVLRILEDLGTSLNRSAMASKIVKLAFTRSPVDTADVILGIIRQKRSESAGSVIALDLWSERPWVTEDPSPGELELVRLCRLNEVAAMAVLGVCSPSDFIAMRPEDRQAVFPNILGQRCLDRLAQNLSVSEIVSTMSPRLTSSSPPAGLLGQLSAIERQAKKSGDDAEPSSDSFDWTEFLESLSQ